MHRLIFPNKITCIKKIENMLTVSPFILALRELLLQPFSDRTNYGYLCFFIADLRKGHQSFIAFLTSVIHLNTQELSLGLCLIRQ